MTSAIEYSTPSDTEFRAVRVFDAPREIVWDAMTNPAHLPKWMLGPAGWSMPVCEADVRPGGVWRYVWQKSDGETMEMTGRYIDVDPPEKFVVSESWGPEWPETVNTGILTEENGRTTLTLTITYPGIEARDAALGTGMKDGMEQSYARFDELLRSMV